MMASVTDHQPPWLTGRRRPVTDGRQLLAQRPVGDSHAQSSHDSTVS